MKHLNGAILPNATTLAFIDGGGDNTVSFGITSSDRTNSTRVNFSVNDAATTYTVTISGSVTLPTGTIYSSGGTDVPVSDGGTGLSSGTSGGIPYFSDSTTMASSAALSANAIVIGGGAGVAPSTTTTGTGVLTALGVNVGSAGAFVTFNGALGSPSSAGTLPAFTLGGTVSGGGNQINNVVIGTSTPLAGTFTTLVAGSTTSLLLGTSGSAVGNIGFRNATSGTATVAPPTGALGTYTVTLPNAASTLPIFGQQATFTGLTAARSILLPDANFSVARIDAAQIFAGAQIFSNASGIAFHDGAADNSVTLGITSADRTNSTRVNLSVADVNTTYTLTINGTATIPTGTLLSDAAAVTVAQGGTGRTTSTTAYGLIAAGTTATGAHQTLAAGLTTQILVGGGTGALPSWGTDLPTGVTIGSGYIYRVGGTDVSVADGGTGLSSGTSGGVPYFSGSTTMASSGALAANAIVIGGGAGAAPSTTTTGTGVLTALGVNVGSAGAFVTFNGAMGTPSSGTLTNCTGLTVAGGGTGLSTLTANGILIGNGTSNVNLLTGKTGQLVYHNGSAWTTAALTSADIPATLATGTAITSAALTTPALTDTEIAITNASTTLTIGRWHAIKATSADQTNALPAASGNTGKRIWARITTDTTKLVTLDGNSSETIDGATTLILHDGEYVELMCDGSNWFVVGRKVIPMSCCIARAATQTGTGSFSDIKIEFDTAELDTAGMADVATNYRINIKRAGRYLVSASGTLIDGNVYTRPQIWINGAQTRDCQFHSATSEDFSTPPFLLSLAAGDYVELKIAVGDASWDTWNNASRYPRLTVVEI